MNNYAKKKQQREAITSPVGRSNLTGGVRVHPLSELAPKFLPENGARVGNLIQKFVVCLFVCLLVCLFACLLACLLACCVLFVVS